MKRYVLLSIILAMIMVSADADAAPPIFKQKKYFGPIPFNTVSISIGFIDGPSAEYLFDHLDNWAVQRNGRDIYDDFATSPFARLGFERQVTPNHFIRTSFCFSYLKATSAGYYVAQYPDTNYALDIERTFEVFLLSVDLGFSYYIIPPEVRRFSPYIGGGFGFVFPLARLNTDSFSAGRPFSNPAENISRDSMQAGLHSEFGMIYYITNRYSATVEGRYQMAQSKFYIHEANFVINYAGFTLSMNFNYHF
jgi:hypothetical protein